jgi:hypothetical protein
MFGEDLGFTVVISAFLLAGVGLILGGIIQFFQTRRFVRDSITTTGTVITLVVRRLDSSTILTRTKTKRGIRTTRKLNPKSPHIRFTTAEGEAITFTHHTASDPPGYKIGQKVNIRYQPSRPHEAQIASFSSLWLMPGLLLFVGLLITAFMVFFVRVKFG